ncbi:unnamed protein product [Aspergillus oryzae var. brunneus]|uniref:Unnamed protein product n=1 Tax=Aspergillus oryzae var. brunneus TaxID=332754 RepID=A0ABQ6LAS3_ASPOZ|nr:unnamed protein product [Aspergillus oryzae var. brunneus]
MHGPNPAERQLMNNWIHDLVAFVNGDNDHSYGTKECDEYKVMTPDGNIEIQKDPRWDELLNLMDVFSGFSCEN